MVIGRYIYLYLPNKCIHAGLCFSRVTIVKNKARKSTGVAFILYLQIDDAKRCASQVNNTELFGRTIKASIAKDNGRSREFIRKRTYEDKSSCYECGEAGHLSYVCPANILGIREPPVKTKRKKPRMSGGSSQQSRAANKALYEDLDTDSEAEGGALTPPSGSNKVSNQRKGSDPELSGEEEEEPDFETLSAAIALDRERAELESATISSDVTPPPCTKRKKIHKNSYFSDEEDVSD